jgi:hypothetical protein
MIGKILACTALGCTLLVGVASAQHADGYAPEDALGRTGPAGFLE